MDNDQLLNEIKTLLEGVETRVDGRLAGLESKLEARIERVETNLLTAFHGYAQGVSTLEDRMINLETRGRSH